MTRQTKSSRTPAHTASNKKTARSRTPQQCIRLWRILNPVIYLAFLLFFYLIVSLCLSSGSMFLIIFGPLLSVFCLIAGPPLLIAFRRPDALYSAEHPPKPASQRTLCLILLLTNLFLVILAVVLWLVF